VPDTPAEQGSVYSVPFTRQASQHILTL